MRPIVLLLTLAGALSAVPAMSEPTPRSPDMAWADALAGSVRDLDPIAAAQIQSINPDLFLPPGLLRLRGLDPQDADQRAALDGLFRSLEASGYTPQRLRTLHIDGTADRRVVEDLSKAYGAGLVQAKEFAQDLARTLDASTPGETSAQSVALVQSRLRAMALLYGDAAVSIAKQSLRRRLQADGAAAAVLFSLP